MNDSGTNHNSCYVVLVVYAIEAQNCFRNSEASINMLMLLAEKLRMIKML